jgi:hypothetical protein
LKDTKIVSGFHSFFILPITFGVGSNSKASDVEFSDEEVVTEEILVLRLDAIVVAA